MDKYVLDAILLYKECQTFCYVVYTNFLNLQIYLKQDNVK